MSQKIDIKRAVIHILDRNSREPFLNDFEMDMGEGVVNFLSKHIVKALSDDDLRKAKLIGDKNIISEISRRIFDNSEMFLEGSKVISRELFRAMKTHSQISSTDLVICLYEASGESQIAILKMDYGTSFIHEVHPVGDQFKITILKQEISLPGPGQKLQKCAFISCGTPSGMDLLLLDNQMNDPGNKEPVAQFFLRDFLGAQLVNDDKACTRMLKRETDNFLNAKEKSGEPAVQEARQYINMAIRREEVIDIEELSNKAFEAAPEIKEAFVASLKERGLDKEKFQVDREWVEKKFNTVRLKLDSSIEINIPFEDFSSRDRFEMTDNGDGTRSITIKNVWNISER